MLERIQEEIQVPEVERPEPPYLQITRHLREEIVSGRLAEGDPVPSARQISAEWGVAHATAAKVLRTLRMEGLVQGVPGARTVVTAQEVLYRSARDRTIAIHRTGKIYPPDHYANIRSAELAKADDRVADALGLEEGVQVIRRQRTVYDPSDQPVSTSVSWFDAALAALCPNLLVVDRIKGGTMGYIEERTGRVAVRGYDQLAAGTATDEDAAELDIPPGTPVLLGRNRWIDDHGAVLEYGEAVCPPGRWAFYEYTMEKNGATTT